MDDSRYAVNKQLASCKNEQCSLIILKIFHPRLSSYGNYQKLDYEGRSWHGNTGIRQAQHAFRRQ